MLRTLLGVAASVTVLFAAVPTMISYQGRLTDSAGNLVADGTYQLTFSIYNALSGGTAMWTSGAQTVAVAEGLFNYNLGSSSPLPDSIFAKYTQVYLGIKVGADAEITPRTQLLSVGYAFRALRADSTETSYWRLADSVVYTRSKLGIARGESDNCLWGDSAYTHVNLGTACTTGTAIANAGHVTLAGGYGNAIAGDYSAIVGGNANKSTGDFAVIAGGSANQSSSSGSVVIGGYSNVGSAWGAVIGGGRINSATWQESAVLGGASNRAQAPCAAIVGGSGNLASNSYAVIVGGHSNIASGISASIAGGYYNQASAQECTVGGGMLNSATSMYATVVGGSDNSAEGGYSSIAGGQNNEASGNYAVAVGGSSNNSNSATVVGGTNNSASQHATVVGGYGNTASSSHSVTVGGSDNSAEGSHAAITGGQMNRASGQYSYVGGGQDNVATHDFTAVGGGVGNRAFGTATTIGGGYADTTAGYGSTVPGGFGNVAAGITSFAAGNRAKSRHDGTFIWADYIDIDFVSTGGNQFLIRASGGVGIGTNSPTEQLDVNGKLHMRDNIKLNDNWLSNDGGDDGVFVAANGYVGIGESGPNGPLHVYDAVNITSGSNFDKRVAPLVVGRDDIASGTLLIDGNQIEQALSTDRLYLNNTSSSNISMVMGGGSVGIGINSPSQKLHVIGNICYTGTIGACSDERYKKDVTTIGNALETLLKLRGVTYNWKQDEYPEMKFDDQQHLGFLAQELKDLLPGIVMVDANGYLSVDYGRLTPLLVEAMKEQQETIDALKAQQREVESLKAQMAELSATLLQLDAKR